MKGDFTRFTFQPEKRYTSVLMQQGRLQLDADWNEQMSIQAYLNQAQALDMIGSSGASRSEDGFRITPTLDQTDLLINPGSFYLNGALCELPSGTKTRVTFQSWDANAKKLVVQVPSLVVDDQSMAIGQWVDVLIDLKGDAQSTFPFAIEAIQFQQQILTLVSRDPTQTFLADTFNASQQLSVCRLITYNTQPDHPQSMRADLNEDQLADGSYLVYLDVWQRHITAIEDPNIREEALEVPDTTTRTKIIWQVKLLTLNLKKNETPPDNPQEWKELTQKRQVLLNARTQVISGNNSIRSSQQLDNQLYRIEVHTPGPLGTATFKWSRDNGSIVGAIDSISPKDNLLKVKASGRDASQSFERGQWIEVTNETRELNNLPGTLVRITDVTADGQVVRLTFNPATMTGDAITAANFPPESLPKVRRWDWDRNPTVANQASILIPAGNDVWIDLENGIQVNFSIDKGAIDPDKVSYKTGDYWLIPSRSVTNSIAWKCDSLKRPSPQPPQGIDHQYAQLAIVTVEQSKYAAKAIDRRVTFPPLKDCFDKLGDTIDGSFGIGVKKSFAKLHVQGEATRIGTGTLSSVGQSLQVNGTGTLFPDELHPGDVIITKDANRQTRIVVAIASDGKSITVNQPFSPALNAVSFNYQQPILRLDDSTPTPQLVLNAQSNLGLGTTAPDAKLTVESAIDPAQPSTSTAALHLKAKTAQQTKSLLYVANSGRVGIGTTSPDTALHLQGGLKVAHETGSSVLIESSAAQTTFTTTAQSYRFDKSLAISSGSLTVRSTTSDSSSAGLQVNNASNESLLLVRNDGNVGIGIPIPEADLHLKETLRVGTTNAHVQLQTSQQRVRLTTGSTITGYDFDKGIHLPSGSLTVSENLGIGTIPTASNKLEIKSSTSDNTTTALQIRNSSDTSLLVVRSDGAVGIGTTDPDANTKLHVSGAIKIGTDAASVTVSASGNQASFTSATNTTTYSFDKPIAIRGTTTNSTALMQLRNANNTSLFVVRNDGAIGVGIEPAAIETKLHVLDGAIRLSVPSSSTSTSPSFVQLRYTDKQATFTSSDDTTAYNFDRRILVSNGNLAINNGNLRVGTAVTQARLEVTGSAALNANEPIAQVNKSDGTSLFSVRNNGEVNLGSSTGANSVSGSLKVRGSSASLSVGVAEPQAALHVKGGLISGNGTIDSNGITVKLSNGDAFRETFQVGDILIAGNDPDNARVITAISTTAVEIEINQPFNPNLRGAAFQYGAIARFTSNLGRADLFFASTRNTMILGITPSSNLYLMADKILASGEWRTTGATLQVSSRTLKDNIAELSTQEARTILDGINPVKFHYKRDLTQQQLGFIAEDLPEAVVSADKQAINVTEIVAVLTKTVKDQQRAITSLIKVAKEQQEAIAHLQSRL